MREDTEALLLGRGASKMCLGGPLLAAKNGLGWDHFWQGGTTFSCQKWSGGTTFGCQKWSGGPLLGGTTFGMTDLLFGTFLAL